MALYLVGDIQGCFDELEQLLKTVGFCQSSDQLWLAGDLVARGPKSLETIRYIKSLGESANFVLGNHDLHLLATIAGLKKAKAQDFLEPLLNAKDIDDIADWLAQHPLLLQINDEPAYMSHAGKPPQWTVEQTVENAAFAHKKLAGKKREKWLGLMYGNKPNDWHDVNSKEHKFRYTINALTRMRYCYKDGSLEFDCKQSPENAPKKLQPWYELSCLDQHQWVFGHWAALMGQIPNQNIYALDTGCVWGGHLSMLRWHDKKIFTQPAFRAC